MVIKEKITVKPLQAKPDTAAAHYPGANTQQSDRAKLEKIIKVLTDYPEAFKGRYVLYIEKKALEAFSAHANEVFSASGHEATGLLVGYWLSKADDERQRVAIATDFLPSEGGSSVTCEITYEDSVRNDAFCREHGLLPLAWPHTHPFNRPLFYSSVDSDTLRCNFSGEHQMGVVHDNLSGTFMGFKIVNGKQCHESIWCLDIEESLTSDGLSVKCLYGKTVVIGEKRPGQGNELKPWQPTEFQHGEEEPAARMEIASSEVETSEGTDSTKKQPSVSEPSPQMEVLARDVRVVKYLLVALLVAEIVRMIPGGRILGVVKGLALACIHSMAGLPGIGQ